jgi:hypothetical protein
VTRTDVIGGTNAISPKVYTQLPNPARQSGGDRYATSAALVTSHPPTGGLLYIATGTSFPDALTGGILAATNSSNILLLPKDGPTPIQIDLLKTLRGKKAVALGGEQAIPADLMQTIQSYLQ